MKNHWLHLLKAFRLGVALLLATLILLPMFYSFALLPYQTAM